MAELDNGSMCTFCSTSRHFPQKVALILAFNTKHQQVYVLLIFKIKYYLPPAIASVQNTQITI